jgi:putative transcriptional regulator
MPGPFSVPQTATHAMPPYDGKSSCVRAATVRGSDGCCPRSRSGRRAVVNVALLLHSIYAMDMSRKPKTEEELVTNRVEALRDSAGLTRQELADRVGVHYQTIGYIERGEYSPSLVLALKIAHVLDRSVEDIFWLEDSSDE